MISGTTIGGRKAAETNKRRYGTGFFKEIGKLGGEVSRGGALAKDPEFARRMGKIGGLRSSRRKASS